MRGRSIGSRKEKRKRWVFPAFFGVDVWLFLSSGLPPLCLPDPHSLHDPHSHRPNILSFYCTLFIIPSCISAYHRPPTTTSSSTLKPTFHMHELHLSFAALVLPVPLPLSSIHTASPRPSSPLLAPAPLSTILPTTPHLISSEAGSRQRRRELVCQTKF